MDAAMQLRVAMLHVWEEARSGVIAPPFVFCPRIATREMCCSGNWPTSRIRASQKGRLIPTRGALFYFWPFLALANAFKLRELAR
jgi:hypothetical protein